MPVLVSLPVCMPDDAHEDDGQAETDSGRGGVCGGRTEPVRLCGILSAFRNQGIRGHKTGRRRGGRFTSGCRICSGADIGTGG